MTWMGQHAAHLTELSHAFPRDAKSGHLSPRGQLDALFESGYAALLTTVSDDVVRREEHPSISLTKQVCDALGMAHYVATHYIAHKYDPDDGQLPTHAEMLAWTTACRACTV